ncbi:MAG: hypothetical protein V7L20_30380 [Nostoc sp.]|uniref:hypothetical protein n=1 Tax=Nostoc sp. TaxID=1180 RepID=UPI002FF48679
MGQEIKNEPSRVPSTPRNKKLRDLAQLHKETVSEQETSSSEQETSSSKQETPSSEQETSS